MTKQSHILFVDDEAGNRLSFKAYFRRKYIIRLASDAGEAMELIKALSFDMVLSDQRMPGLTGLEFFTWLRKYDDHIPRILVSGSVSNHEKESALKSGLIHAWVQKPWNVIELENLIFQNIVRA